MVVFVSAVVNTSDAIVNVLHDMGCACRNIGMSNARACLAMITASCTRTWSCQRLVKPSETAEKFHTPENSPKD